MVDDFGAIADGVTDCTVAIQRAMDSGKKVIFFGLGSYKIERTIKVPATVKTIDFQNASIIAGLSLIIGEMESMFDICEECEEPFFAENFSADLLFCSGFFRLFKHSSKRTAVFKDMASARFISIQSAEATCILIIAPSSHHTIHRM